MLFAMKKSFELFFYSTLGVAAVFLILLAVNFLAGRVPKRIDLTAEKAYTLSEGTRAILAKLDAPVKIRLYCTRNENMPPQLKLYAQQVEELLSEYRQASNGRLEIQKLDPEPDSDAEDSAKLDGVEGQLLPNGEKLYLGLSVSQLDQKETIPFLSPDRERLLEYDLSRAITRAISNGKQVIGIMSSLSVTGQKAPNMLMQMNQPLQAAWAFYNELKRDFIVKEVDVKADKIPDDINVLVVIHPRPMTDELQYAIDQFVLRGGKLIAFLDPCAVMDPTALSGYVPHRGSSNFDKLLGAWGIYFDSHKVILDMNLSRSSRGRMPGVMALNGETLSKDDILTANASNLVMVFAGAFSGNPVAGLKETVLIKSSKNAQLVEPMDIQTSTEDVVKNFVSADQEFPMAIRLTGKFKTAFPDGAPKPASDKKAPAPAQSLKESAQENTVVLIGDTDIVQDSVAVVERQNPFGGKMQLPANGNLAFAQSAIEQLAGDNNLIAVRSRAIRERPFTVVQQMQEAAESSYRNKIKELETSLADTQRKLGELQQQRQTSSEKNTQRFILSPEQQAELEKFRKSEASAKKQLKEVRRNLRADTDALENRIKWINIAGMPAMVTLAGIGLAILKRKRVTAK